VSVELDDFVWNAINRFEGGFSLMRALRDSDGDEIADWELLYANDFVRARWRGDLPQDGAQVSTLEHARDSKLGDLQRAALASGEPQRAEMILDAPAGPAWRRVMSIPVAADIVASMTFDISDVVDLEARVTTLSGHVSSSEARMRSIVETAGDGIVTVDKDGIVDTFNQAAERIFATRAHDVIGHPYAELVPPASIDHLRAYFALTERVPHEPTEVVARRADGSEFLAQVSLSSVMTDDGVVFTAIVRDITRQRQIEEQLEYMALHDDHTGLPNRRALTERVRTTLASSTSHVVGLLCIDLDDFKLVNDTLGEGVGDRLLTLVASRLTGALDPGDVVARPGGDEFMVLCDLRGSMDSLVRTATRISEELRAPFSIGLHEVFVTASIGIAAAREGVLTSPTELMRNAHTAMHRAKRRGRAQIELFDQGMRIELAARLGLESSLRRALERNELRAVYQPIVELSGGAVVRQEALVRWHRPDVGVINPVDFIQVAEETGLIVPLGEWMLTRATTDAAAWQDEHPNVGVAVNVSGRQLDRSDLPSAVSQALRTSGLRPGLLTLEITESVLLHDETRMYNLLNELRSIGVRLAIDDFGTGYSSLTYLHRLPIDELKIDGSFIRTLERSGPDVPLVDMMVRLGAALGLDTVAEHIDSERKAEILRGLGCTYGQGFHFGRPVSRD
jgi:diguanylate cyclase (GGDEF)-like protein/PAS domain S-box-containing protein